MAGPGDQQANADDRTGTGGLLAPKPKSHRPFDLIEARIPAVRGRFTDLAGACAYDADRW
jgi:hypothetical protein